MTEEVNTRLSYSSGTLLKNCSMKYYHYKVAGVAKDPDSEDNSDAFNIGKAFHWVLEENNHTEDNLVDLLEKAVKNFNVEDSMGMLHAMLLRYLKLHKKSGLVVKKCELGLQNDIFEGYIDAIMTEEDGTWWVVDLKTARIAAETTFARLKTDTQLNLYCSFADDIALLLGLDRGKFGGARYRVTTKSVLKKKANESYFDHVMRTAKNIKSYDIIIPVSEMNPEQAYKDHELLHSRSMDLRHDVLKPEKNLSYCDSFFKPCEYWSRCHGDTFTNCKGALQMITENVE
jgi:hypothetical protein